jgi:hypothetical protein
VRVELAQVMSEERNAMTRLSALLGKTEMASPSLDRKADVLPVLPSRADLQSLVSSSFHCAGPLGSGSPTRFDRGGAKQKSAGCHSELWREAR